MPLAITDVSAQPDWSRVRLRVHLATAACGRTGCITKVGVWIDANNRYQNEQAANIAHIIDIMEHVMLKAQGREEKP